MVWRKEDPMGSEAQKIKYYIAEYTRGRGLELGSGKRTFPHFITLDNLKDEELFGKDVGVPDVKVDDARNLDLFSDGSMDFVFSSHLLEHIADYKAALKEWWRVIRPGGYLVLYLPHKEFYPNVGDSNANPDHKHDFVPDDIIDAMMEVGSWDLIINQDRNEDDEYSFFQVYEKGEGSDVFSFSYKDPRPDKTAAVVRYGAFGDMFQCAPVLAALREEGYHTTLITCPRGYQAVSNDPNIDRVILHDTGQIPIHELHHFLGKWSKMYDRFVHLSESVEGSLLVMPGRVIRTWPTKARDLLLNVNYGEITAAIAEIDYKKWHKHQKFYETTEEREWVEKLVQSAEGSPIVTFCLSGSSVHKAWPYLDNIIAKLLLDTNALIILTGDSWCQILEQGWTEEPRVMCKSNKWSIRQSLVTAKYSDMVIGPETGVMNAVSYEKMPKILLLSHSSVENLPRDWTNTYALFSPDTPCYPCHMMHYDWSSCRREENTGAAFCQASILPGQMWEAIEHAIRKNPKWKTPKLVNQNGERLSVQSA